MKEAVIVASKEAAIKINTTASCRKATREKRTYLREAGLTILGGEIIHALSQHIDFVRRLSSFLECELGLRQFISQLGYNFGVAVEVIGEVVGVVIAAYSSDDVGSGVGFCGMDERECCCEEDDGEKETSFHEKDRMEFSLFLKFFFGFDCFWLYLVDYTGGGNSLKLAEGG